MEKRDEEDIEKSIRHILEEARMILPGIQALLGFQLIAVFNQSFKSYLTTFEQHVHLIAIFFSLTSICFLMTPAAIDRLGNNTPTSFVKLASLFVAAGMVPLLLSFCMDFYVVGRLVLDNWIFSAILSFFVACGFTYFWFVMPFLRLKMD